MKALRTIGILVLVAGLMLGSVGTVFAKGNHVPPGKPPKFEGQKRGFSGNVTEFDPISGNVTIDIGEESYATVMLTEAARYKIPRVMNKWGNLTEFTDTLGGDLSVLVDRNRRVVALAGNVTGDPPGPFAGEAVRLMLLPEPGLPALHAHRTGNVTDFTPGADGNITIIDIHGELRLFDLADGTSYRLKGLGEVSDPPEGLTGSFVTVVIMGDPKVEPGDRAIAKVIVVHPGGVPEGWPTPAP